MEKLPFVFKIGEKYWSYSSFGCNGICVCKYVWNNSGINKQRKAFGLVFKTKQEVEAYLPTWQKKLKGLKI